jgi:hypothetical protein
MYQSLNASTASNGMFPTQVYTNTSEQCMEKRSILVIFVGNVSQENQQ